MKSAVSLDALLAALGPVPEQAAQTYRDLHARLVRLFTLNNAADPGALADETLDRLAHSVASREIDSPLAFALGIARLLLKEEARRQAKEAAASREWKGMARQPSDASETQALLDQLDGCLERMDPERRDLLRSYYTWPEGGKIDHHRTMAERLGLSTHALRNRLLRARADLTACMEHRQHDVSFRSGTLFREEESETRSGR